MRQSIAAILITAILSTIFCLSPAAETEGKKPDEKLKLYSQSAVLMDADSGRVLYGKEENLIRPMASTTKIMTCILALEMGNLDDKVTVTQNAAIQPKVHLGMKKGETYYLKDLLHSLMLESHNDTAVAIAEHIGGSVEGFAVLMNQKARDMGCTDTFFITPNGLDAKVTDQDGNEKTHSTTARDLARIMKYCLTESDKKEEFVKITGTRNYFFTDVPGKRSFNCTNHNALLSARTDAVSGKTGFTGGAGYSYVGAVKRDGRVFIIALLGCGWPPNKTYKWSDANLLFNYGIQNYHYKELKEDHTFPPVPVEDGIPEENGFQGQAYTEFFLGAKKKQVPFSILLRDDERVYIKYDIPKKMTAPVQKGDVVGSVVYTLNGEVIKTHPIYVKKSVGRRDFSWSLKKVIAMFVLSQPEPKPE